MKSLFHILRLASVLFAGAASLAAREPAALIDFTPVSEWPQPMPFCNIGVGGKFACVTYWDARVYPSLRVFDVSDPSRHVAAGALNLPVYQAAEEVVVSGNFAYLRFFIDGGPGHFGRRSDGGFHVIDISTPSRPVLTGTYWLPGQNISTLEVHGRYVCVAYYSEDARGTGDFAGFRVVDVSNPANPVPAGQCPIGESYPKAMAIGDNRACLIHGRSLVIVDLSNPLQPSVSGRYGFPEAPEDVLPAFPADVAVAGNHAFVVTCHDLMVVGEKMGEAGLEVFDISDPARPTPVGQRYFEHGGAGVAVVDGHAFVVPCVRSDDFPGMTHMGREVHVYNVIDPARARRVDRGNFTTQISGVAVAGDLLFVPGAGIYRITKIPPADPVLSMKLDHPASVPELWAQCPGHDDFSLTTSTSLTEWQPCATVFSRLGELKVVPEKKEMSQEPRRFYRASTPVESPDEVSRKWEAARPDGYIFRFERTESGGGGVLSGIVEVFPGEFPEMYIYEARLNGNPIANPSEFPFTTVDGLFWLLNTSRSRSDLMIVKWDATLHFPTWIYIDADAETSGDEVTIRVTDLYDNLVEVVPPPDLPLECKCLPPPWPVAQDVR